MKHGYLLILLPLALGPGCKSKSTFTGSAKTTDAPKQAAEAKPKPEPAPVEGVPEQITPAPEPNTIFKECDKSPNTPISAELFELPKDTQKLPNYNDLKSIKKVCLKQLDIAPRSFNDGFPGVTDLKEWFSLNFKFNVEIKEPGEYTFTLKSDDGSKLFIDNKLVIDHDGQHAPSEKSGKTTLTKGKHSFNVPYFQGPADQIALELFWVKPGSSTKEYIPVELISRLE